MGEKSDLVDRTVSDLGRELPDLDTAPLAVAERVQRLSGHLRRNLETALAPTGVGIAGFGVLAALRRAGKPYELMPSQLTRETLLTSGAMTNRIDRLERAGLVERRGQRGTDRRTVLIRLTPAGRKLIDSAYPVYCGELARLFGPMTPAGTAALERGLREASLALGDAELGSVGDPERP